MCKYIYMLVCVCVYVCVFVCVWNCKYHRKIFIQGLHLKCSNLVNKAIKTTLWNFIVIKHLKYSGIVNKAISHLIYDWMLILRDLCWYCTPFLIVQILDTIQIIMKC